MHSGFAILSGKPKAKCLPPGPHFSPRLWGLSEGRGFSPAEIAPPALCSSRAPRSLQPQAARGAGIGNNQDGLAAARLKPRPSGSVQSW